jgi:hypothetical protein
LIRHISAYLSSRSVAGEPVESLACVRHLSDAPSPLHRAQLPGAHPGSSGRGLHALWQHHRRPDLQALGGTGRLAGFQRVERRAAHEDRTELGILRRGDDDPLRLVAGRRSGRAAETDHGREPPNAESDSRGTERESASHLWMSFWLIHVARLLVVSISVVRARWADGSSRPEEPRRRTDRFPDLSRITGDEEPEERRSGSASDEALLSGTPGEESGRLACSVSRGSDDDAPFHRARTKTVCRVISSLGPHVVLGTGSEYLWRISSPSTRKRRPCTANAQ